MNSSLPDELVWASGSYLNIAAFYLNQQRIECYIAGRYIADKQSAQTIRRIVTAFSVVLRTKDCRLTHDRRITRFRDSPAYSDGVAVGELQAINVYMNSNVLPSAKKLRLSCHGSIFVPNRVEREGSERAVERDISVPGRRRIIVG
jgi:hypothetical protein